MLIEMAIGYYGPEVYDKDTVHQCVKVHLRDDRGVRSRKKWLRIWYAFSMFTLPKVMIVASFFY